MSYKILPREIKMAVPTQKGEAGVIQVETNSMDTYNIISHMTRGTKEDIMGGSKETSRVPMASIV